MLTLGGYHPAFAKPPEFPVVPRLGFHWAVSNSVMIKGESYFALTSSCVMAGGRLEARYKSGGIEASFVVYADFLIVLGPVPLRHQRGRDGVGRIPQAGLLLRLRHDRRQRLARRVGAHPRAAAARRGQAGPRDLQRHGRVRPPGAPPPSFIGWDEFVASTSSPAPRTAAPSPRTPAPGSSRRSPARRRAVRGHRTKPWHFVGDFSLRTETRMPATGLHGERHPGLRAAQRGVQAVPGASTSRR